MPTDASVRAGPAVRGTRTVPDRVLGVAGVVMVVAALLLLLFGGPGDGADASIGVGVPPALTMLSPAAGDVVESPLSIRFSVPAPISRSVGGWGIEGFHLHAEVAGREVMPGPADIRRIAGDVHEWTIPSVPSGPQTVRLFWSDGSHRALPESATPPVPFSLR